MLQTNIVPLKLTIGFGNGRVIRVEVRQSVRGRRKEMLPIPVGFLESEQYFGIPRRRLARESRIRLREKMMERPFAGSFILIFHDMRGTL